MALADGRGGGAASFRAARAFPPAWKDTSPRGPAIMPHKSARPRSIATLAVLGLVAVGLYGATLMRFGVMMGGGQ